MMAYLSYFKLRFITGLQYRASAIAGIFTQLFFAIIYIMIYLAFYESDAASAPMEFNQLISYLWLNQILFSLVSMWYKDKDILNIIKNGNISYELCRPQEIYFMWFCKIISTRLAAVILRSIPVIIIAFILPSPYGLSLPDSMSIFLIFLLSLIIGTILMSCIVTLYHVITMFTLDEKGVVGIFIAIADIFSGLVIPLPFFPDFLIKIANLLPFRYVSDLPFRIYCSHISIDDAWLGIFVQFIWIFILMLLGYLCTKKALKKAVIQGG